MTCPTCDHTMERIDADNGGPGLFWCPRCGTLSKQHDVLAFVDEISVPKLVERCRRFLFAGLTPQLAQLWVQLGIEEAIHTPKERRKP